MECEKALELLKRQLSRLTEEGMPRKGELFPIWKRDTEVIIERIFGRETRHYAEFTEIRYVPTVYHRKMVDADYVEAFRRGIKSAEVLLKSIISEVKELGFATENGACLPQNDLDQLENICRKFHVVARTLRSRHADRATFEVDDEYDVQDLLNALLRLHFGDVRPEEWTPSYAGKASRVDFLLKNERIVIEVKKTRKGLGAKEVGDQLLIDIGRYKVHPDCNKLICFVYDPEGRVANPKGVIRDIEEEHSWVRVFIEP